MFFLGLMQQNEEQNSMWNEPGPCGMTRPGIEAKPAEQSTKAEQTGQEPTRAEQTRPELTRAEQTGLEPTRAEQTRPGPTRAEQTRPEPTRAEQTRQEPTRAEQTNFNLPFLLQTDTSDRGLGAVLAQVVEGEERSLLYLSRKLSKRETRYSTIEKECLAIRWAVLTLRYYLLGQEFTLCSDHAPLQWLHRMKDTNARITWWYLALQPFKFKVIHRLGVRMAVAMGGGAAGRRAPRPKTGGGGMWRGARGKAERAKGRAGLETSGEMVGK